MTIGEFFILVTLIFTAPNVLKVIRAIYVYYLLKKVRFHINEIVCYETKYKKICLDENEAEKYIDSLHHVYWSFDKMVENWWVWNLNKMRN